MRITCLLVILIWQTTPWAATHQNSLSTRMLNESKFARTQTLDLNNMIQHARQLIALDRGREAYKEIRPRLKNEKNFILYMLAAQSMAMENNPEKALGFYKNALYISTNSIDKIAALYGVAKIQFWLGHYVAAGKTYQLLLECNLNKQEYELALAGYVKSLSYYNRPRLAYKKIPTSLQFTIPELVIAASQASLWSGWPDITKNYLTVYQPIIKNVNLNSGLGRDLQDLSWQTKLVTSPHVLTPAFFYSLDSEHFEKKQSSLDYSHYWNRYAQTTVGLEYIDYTQTAPNRLNAEGVRLGQTIQATRALTLAGQIEPLAFKHRAFSSTPNWNPLLWKGGVSYTPNDYVSTQVGALKEIIETFPAFNHEITDNQYAVSLTLNPFPYVSVNGAFTTNKFSDENAKNGYYLSSAVQILPNIGLSAVGSYREYGVKFKSPYYFSPYNYKTGSFLLKLGRKLGPTWHYYLDGGLGRQFIVAQKNDARAASPTYQWGLGFTGPLTPCLILNAYFADLRQVSAFLGSPNYHYQYGAVSLNVMI